MTATATAATVLTCHTCHNAVTVAEHRHILAARDLLARAGADRLAQYDRLANTGRDLRLPSCVDGAGVAVTCRYCHAATLIAVNAR